MFRYQNLEKLVILLVNIRAFLLQLNALHTKAWKFKRPLSQNKEPLLTKDLLIKMFSFL